MKKLNLFNIIGIFGLCAVLLSSCTRISPTEAGFKINNAGSYRGVEDLPLLTGWQFYNPMTSSVITISTTMQHKVWTENAEEGSRSNEEIIVPCKGGSGVKIDVGLNYFVEHDKANQLWIKYKMDDLDQITNTYLRNIVRGTLQDFSSQITVDSILNNLTSYESMVKASLQEKFRKEGLHLDNFNIISAPRPIDPLLALAINQKIIAKQNSETSKQQLELSINEANKKIASARGDSAQAVIEASGRAEAINKLQHQLTPEYIDYLRVQTWDGKLPTYMLGSNASTLLQFR